MVEIQFANIAQAEAALPTGVPIHMINLLRFRERAEYDDRFDAAPCSGRDAYFGRYIPKFRQITAGQGIRAIWMGNAVAELAGAPGRWDVIAIGEYPSFAAFRAAIECTTYKVEAEPHRLAALEDWRLIATLRADIP